MKTRIVAIAAMCAIAMAASCQKAEQEISVSPKTATITATIDNATKTAYENESTFSWVASDVILLVVEDKAGDAVDHFSYSADAGGQTAAFSGTAFGPGSGNSFEKWTASGYALYPNELEEGGAPGELEVVLPRVYKKGGSNPMSRIPLIGVQTSDTKYQFKTAVGVLKLTFSNVPSYARRVTLFTNDNPVSGSFPLNATTASEGIKMADGLYTDTAVSVEFPAPESGSDLTVYIPVPVGTLSEGACFALEMEDGTILFSTNQTVRDIAIKRNTVKNLTPTSPIEVSIWHDDDINNVIGLYDMHVTEGLYSDEDVPSVSGRLRIEASDDASKGNVMMTMFADVEGKAYGTFDGLAITFDKDQLFAPNPYADAAENPYIALDFFNSGVKDPVLTFGGQGYLEAVGFEAIGFRSTTEDKWLNDSHNGGFPWVLCYGSLNATLRNITRGERIYLYSNMIEASDVCGHDGIGVWGMLDDVESTYWHSNWYYPVEKNDPVYGIYFDITLDKDIDAAGFKYQVRQGNANSRPLRFVVGASADGVNWTKFGDYATSAMENAGESSWVDIPNTYFHAYFNHIRIGIADTADPTEGVTLTGDLSFEGGKKSTNLAELQLYWAAD